MSTFLEALLILVVGGVAGIINTLAGGGSLLTLPVLIFIGLPAPVANGTNRIAIFIQSLTASYSFSRKGFIDKKLFLWFGLPAVVGSIIGADLAISISDRVFTIVLAIIMVIAVIFIIWNPNKGTSEEQQAFGVKRKMLGALSFFAIGLYGGFIQAGTGLFILTLLASVFGFSLVKSNAYKNAIVCLYMFFAILVFLWNGEINWLYGIILAIGNATGAWIGSNIAINKGDRWIKVILFITVIGMAIKLIFFS